MKIPYLCLLIVALQPYLWTVLAKRGQRGQRFDNHVPRQVLAGLTGWPQRANWAQQNAWEALPVFGFAVLMAMQAQVPADIVNTWSVVFVVARFVYGACYIGNWATVRSLVWSIGMFAALRLMVAAI
ncbi:MAG: MAPEG family protein [Burkholderiales bacterium]